MSIDTDRIFEPGFVYDMDDETYHADPVPGGSLSSTLLRRLTEFVPAKARARFQNRKPTAAMNLGKAVHSHALGVGPELIVWEHDGRTKAGKEERAAVADLLESEAAVAVKADDKQRIEDMVAALLEHREIRDILAASKPEVSGFWNEGNVWCRARYDLLGDTAPWDYKTTIDASRQGFSRSLAKYGYHQQAEFYQRGLRALGHPAADQRLRFICQETEPPYLVQVHSPDDEAWRMAAKLNEAAIDAYADATRTGIWPGYGDLFAEPTSLPNYYLFEHYDEEDLVI